MEQEMYGQDRSNDIASLVERHGYDAVLEITEAVLDHCLRFRTQIVNRQGELETRADMIEHEVTYHDGEREHVGHYRIHDQMVTVRCEYGEKSAQIGGIPPEVLARRLLWELVPVHWRHSGLPSPSVT
jgi:hypothetical protein